jgi:uncharacterized Rossmann fold enzyme
MKGLKDKYKGERVFVIGNGPSLKDINMSLLKDEFTFSFNRAYIAYNDWGFYPSFYMCVDEVVLPDNKKEIIDLINKKETKKTLFFFPHKAKNILINKNRVFYFGAKSFINDFNENIQKWAVLQNVGATSMQIAVYLGFKTIILLGCDCNYVEKPDSVIIDRKESRRVGWTAYESKKDDDPNHFLPGYFGKGKKYSIPNAQNHLLGWNKIKKWIDIYNMVNSEKIKILNASNISKITCFAKCDINDVMKDNNGGNIDDQKAIKDKSHKENLVIFGAGSDAKLFLERCGDRFNIRYFVDNDKKKWGECYFGKNVMDPDILLKDREVDRVAIAIKNGIQVLKDQLGELKISDKAIYYEDLMIKN